MINIIHSKFQTGIILQLGLCSYPNFRITNPFFGSGLLGLRVYPKASEVRRYSFGSEISLKLRFCEYFSFENFSFKLKKEENSKKLTISIKKNNDLLAEINENF